MPNMHVNVDASPAALRLPRLRAGYVRRWASVSPACPRSEVGPEAVTAGGGQAPLGGVASLGLPFVDEMIL